MTPLAGLLALLLSLVPAFAFAQAGDDESCVARCTRLKEEGKLRSTVSTISCSMRLCQEEAARAYERNEFESALYSLDYVRGFLTQSPSFNLLQGRVYYALGRFDEALASFDVVLVSHPQSVRGAAQRGHTLVRLGRVPEARAQFEKILGFPTIDAEFRHLKTRSYVVGNLGVLRLAEGDIAGGEAELQKALDLDPRNKLARTFLTRVVPELESGRAGPAVVPMLVEAFEELAVKRANAALKQLKEALSTWPDFKLGYLVAADIQRRYLVYDQCEQTLTVASRRFPDDVGIKTQRMRCTILRHGAHSTEALVAVQQLQQLAADHPDDPLIREILLLMAE